MLPAIIEFVLGFGLTCLTLVDVFLTILVPGRSRGRLRVAARINWLVLPIARRAGRYAEGPGSRPANSFGPVLSIAAAAAWLILLQIAFGLMLHALSAWFTPHLDSLPEAMYVAGSSLLTLGVSEVDAHGVSRWILLWAGLSGFAVITATISFIMQVQTGLHAREPRVIALASIAGSTPSGLAVLEGFAELGMRDELAIFFRGWTEWSADVLHTHVTYPVLAYFHSADTRGDWLASLEAVLDAATMLMALTDDAAVGAATLTHRAGARTATRLCELFELDTAPPPAHDRAGFAEVRTRLAAAGYAIDDERTSALDRLATLRADYAPRIRALADHLGADRTRLIPERS